MKAPEQEPHGENEIRSLVCRSGGGRLTARPPGHVGAGGGGVGVGGGRGGRREGGGGWGVR